MYVRAYEKSLMVYDEYVAHRHILLIVPPVLLAIGTIGNIFSFCILFKNVKKASTYSYLSALALVDLLVLYIGLLRIWIGQFTTDIVDTNNILCKVGIFLGYVSSDVSVWLIVAVTIERLIVVMFPLRAPRLCNARNARISILIIIALFIVVNGHFLWSVELHHYSFGKTVISKCHARKLFTRLVEDMWPWVDAGIYSFVPFLIIMLFNSFIIKNIVSARQKRNVLRQQSSLRNRNGVSNQNRKQGEASKRITFTLLVVSFTFLITTLPTNLVLIFTSFSDEADNDDDAIFAKRKLISTSAEMLMYVNHSINFFLYCMTGRKFRDQCKMLILHGCMSPFTSVVRGNSNRFSTSRLSMRTSKTVVVNNEHTRDFCARL
ncbi:G-protein coupled receptor daf-37-like [Mercenaria mercenaria]|uniref:G-protein coupled receptor daf-37-like n=1 Tax=Mercenaria mercenaria TaxID=6596 RepID=UPI001E1D8790|nr:G-protein coupled receptor daf-37-like [Mercenaria mercenaria]